ncbi:hypothetical protein MVEN_00039300 [Mycena venus]|uniref:Uncharacterized protein n=1 Tax=Mycena venus TaxID=2733690 RepID=A0A8H6Z9V2_9AGAR|nr:hypothetical protein MVEN_00039300 [Mycena venus]
MSWNPVPRTRAADYARLTRSGSSHSDAIRIVTSSSWNPPSNTPTNFSVSFPDGLHGHCANDIEKAISLLLRLTPEDLKSFMDQLADFCIQDQL